MDGDERHYGSRVIPPSERSLPGLKLRWIADAMAQDERTILDIGCGDGKMLRSLRALYPLSRLFGCDVIDPASPPDCYEFSKVYSAELPYESHKFDAVLIFDVLEHVAEPRAMLREAKRVLAEGGKLIAFVPIEGESLSFYRLFRSVFGDDTYVISKDHIQAFTHREVTAVVAADYEIQQRRYAYHFLGQLMDATFFALLKRSSLRKIFYASNELYRERGTDPSIVSRILNRVLLAANQVAWFESTLLSRLQFLSAGQLLVAKPNVGTAEDRRRC